MTTSPEPDTVDVPGAAVAAALVQFQAQLPEIDKGETAQVPTRGGGSYSYRYADLSDVSRRVLPELSKHGLAFTTCPVLYGTGDVYALRARLTHTSGDYIESWWPLPPGTARAQDIGSAITYGRRYLLCAMTGVAPADDDDDGAAASNARPASRTGPQQPRQLEPDPEPVARAIRDMRDAMAAAGIGERDEATAFVRKVTGRDVSGPDDMTRAEVEQVAQRAREYAADAKAGGDEA